MIPVDYQQGKKIVDTCTCGCKAPFTLAWGGAYGINDYVLKCTKDITHDTIARPAELGPYDIPGFNLFNLKGRQKEMEEKLGTEKATKLLKYEAVVSLTKAGAMEVLQTIWPEAPEVEVLKAALICHQYGLNPLMKHLFLIPFKRRQKGMIVGEDWVTVLGIKANRLIAHRCDHYSYLDNTPRVMTDDEQKRIFGEVDDKRLWAITKLRDSKGNEAQGYGSWPKDEEPYGVEKGNTKANMAFIRSERNALDRLFPGEMPQGVEVIDEEYIEGQYTMPEPEGGEKQKQEGEPNKKVAHESREPSAATISPPKTEKAAKTGAPPTELEAEGFRIDLIWLKESQKALKWSDDTLKTFLVSQYKVSPQGTPEDVLKRLTREQAEDFVNQIDSRLQKQPSLFE
jgi:hypothetical protein